MTKNVFDNPILSGIENVTPYELASSTALHGIEPPAMIIDDILPAGNILIITADPGVGKSWLCMEIERAVSSDTPFLGHFNTLSGSALFVGSDSSEFDYAQQWTRLIHEHEQKFAEYVASLPDEKREELLSEQLGPDWRNGQYHAARFLLMSDFMFDSPEHIRKLIATSLNFEYGPYEDTYDDYGNHTGHQRRKGFRIIIFDSFSKLTRADQNDNTQVEEVFRNIRLISEATGASIVILHHASKKGNDMRGAKAMEAAVDSWIQLSSSPSALHFIKVAIKKFRGIRPDNFSYNMYVENKKDAKLQYHMAATQLESDGLTRAIFNYLEQNAPKEFTISSVTNALAPDWIDKYNNSMAGVKQAVRDRLEKMVALTDPNFPIRSSGGGQRGKVRLYWVSKGKSVAQEEPEESDTDDES